MHFLFRLSKQLNSITQHFLKLVILSLSLVNNIAAQESVNNHTYQTVNIEITTHLGDQQVFVENDLISFFITLDHSAYIYAFYQDAANNIFQILPGKAQTEHYFTAGFYIPFPPKNSAFQFQVQAPFGKEKLWVFASDQKLIVFSEKDADKELTQLNTSLTKIEQRIKTASDMLFGRGQLIIQTHMGSNQLKTKRK